MGAYASNFQSDAEGTVASFTSPDESNWITAHAIATELAIPEVERLWARFQQLGCDKNGVLSLSSPLSQQVADDAFIKNILRSMKSEDGKVSFQSFLVTLKWIEGEDTDKKVRATFHLLNNGHPLDKDLLTKILRQIYPEDSDAAVRRLADVFFTEMDTSRKGYITEEQFVNWVRRMPQETITQLMDFHILPSDISQDAQEQLSEFWDASGRLSGRPRNQLVPSDSLLEEVAQKICRRDWALVGNKLGLLQHDIDYILRKYAGDPRLQAYQMLIGWKRKFGEEAYTDTLDKVLRSSSMSDAALLL